MFNLNLIIFYQLGKTFKVFNEIFGLVYSVTSMKLMKPIHHANRTSRKEIRVSAEGQQHDQKGASRKDFRF